MDDEPAPNLRRSHGVAIGALLALLTSMLLPWWRLRFETEGVAGTVDHLVRPGMPVEDVTTWWTWVSLGLVVLAAVLLFVRLAGRSIQYEPGAWKRDLLVAAGLGALALLACALWPDGWPWWGGRTYQGGNTEVSATGAPVVGFMLVALTVVLLVVAWWLARKAPRQDRSG